MTQEAKCTFCESTEIVHQKPPLCADCRERASAQTTLARIPVLDSPEVKEAMAITEEAFGTPPKSSNFTSSYVCRNGHRTAVYLILMTDGNPIGGSSWDLCHRCSESPGNADLIRMPLEIFGMWLHAGMINTEHYASLAHAVVSGE